jgi:hypothetical protein
MYVVSQEEECSCAREREREREEEIADEIEVRHVAARHWRARGRPPRTKWSRGTWSEMR